MEFKNKKLEEFNLFLKNKKVAVIGLGVSNLPLLDYLYEKGSKVTIFDEKNKEQISEEILYKINNNSFEFSFGKDYLKQLKGFDIIFRSPSCLPTIPELQAEEERGAYITTEIELVLKLTPCKVIGVTGSEGKTTTTTLISEIIKNAGYKCFLGGNIGIPLFTKINEMTPEDIVVLELSSFQLMDMQISPNISVITNITPNHLNIHSSYEEYINAKKNIFKFQTSKDTLIINYDNNITKNLGLEAPGKVIYFSSKEKISDGYIVDNGIIKRSEEKIRKHLIDTKNIKLRGSHNYENICAAIAATKDIVELDSAINTIINFQGVHHRLELVRELNGIKWYNDSAATSPTRTIAALNGFSEDVILIAGGSDKNLDYTPIANPILNHVKKLILIGETSNKIYDAVKNEANKQHKKIDIYKCNSLQETINISKQFAKEGDVVLFSPASASFDMFRNMYDRGDQFKSLVNNIK